MKRALLVLWSGRLLAHVVLHHVLLELELLVRAERLAVGGSKVGLRLAVDIAVGEADVLGRAR